MSNLPAYYKVLNEDGSCYHGGTGRWRVGQRRVVRDELVACQNAIHACTLDQLVVWLGPALHAFDLEEPVILGGQKVYARAGRLGPRIETWNATNAALFAADCAMHVLPLFESEYATDVRPRVAILATRDYLRNETSYKKLTSARLAAGLASLDATWAAASNAAAAAMWAAAVSPGLDGPVAWNGVLDASYLAVQAAVKDAARQINNEYLAEDIKAAAHTVERKWQTERLRQYLTGEVTHDV